MGSFVRARSPQGMCFFSSVGQLFGESISRAFCASPSGEVKGILHCEAGKLGSTPSRRSFYAPLSHSFSGSLGFIVALPLHPSMNTLAEIKRDLSPSPPEHAQHEVNPRQSQEHVVAEKEAVEEENDQPNRNKNQTQPGAVFNELFLARLSPALATFHQVEIG